MPRRSERRKGGNVSQISRGRKRQIIEESSSESSPDSPTYQARSSLQESSSESSPDSPTYHPSTSSQARNKSQHHNQSRETKPSSALSSDEFDHLVQSCVYYLLIADQKKYPIKKTDIKRNVFKEHGRMFSKVLVEARRVLKQVYGIDLVELENCKGQYLLINNLRISKNDIRSDKENGQMGLTAIILTLIFMSGNSMHESQLWQTLKTLGLDPDSPIPHPLFGNIKKFVTQGLVRQMYLDYAKIPVSESSEYEFQWGQRAKLEASKEEMLDFVCDIYHMEPAQWIAQYQDILQDKSVEN